MKTIAFALIAVLLAFGLRAEDDNNVEPAEIEKAREAMQEGKREKAIELATKAIEKHPKNGEALVFRARLYASYGAHQRAVNDYDAVLKLDNDRKAILFARGESHFKLGHFQDAIKDFNDYMAAFPNDIRPLMFRARAFERLHEHAKAIADCDAALKYENAPNDIYQFRGQEHFRAGHIKESIADFDEYIKANPDAAPHHWQRGISLYYAGRFDDGVKQFELHQTVNPSDVENAVWHFLCKARASTPEKARAALIPIDNDGRVPMMQIYALFKGDAKPDDVLNTAQAGTPSAAELNDRMFYAHLYLGIYYEAIGEAAKAREHIFKSVDDYKSPHYMGDVARVHAAIFREKK